MLFKKLLALFFCITVVVTTAGCSADNMDARIYFELPDAPFTVDPQTASSVSELLLVRNLYEGLLREDNDGNIVGGVAENYSVNGLVYTFELRPDAAWDDGTALTAKDFVYAMKRAVLPQTKSPFASSLFSIENAEKIYNGQVPVDSLAVKAIDKHTLQITLCRKDQYFEQKLTTAPFMPCNQKFFEECVGKYGLGKGYVLVNGSYYLGKWNTDSFGMRLYKNSQYKGSFSAKNGALFLSHKTDSTAIQRLGEENVDAAILSGGQVKEAKELGLSTVSAENICWVLSFGGNLNEDMKKAFRMSMNSEYYASSLRDGFSVADSFFPSCLAVDSEDVATVYAYDVQKAKELFFNAVNQTQDKKFPETTLYYFGEDYMKDAVTSVVGHWQKTLSAFINIKAVEGAETLASQLQDNTLQMALFPITVNSSSPHDYADIFGKKFENATQLQQELLKNHNLYPFAFQETVLAYNESLSNIHIKSQGGYIDFSQVVKTK